MRSERVTLLIGWALMERVRDAVYWTPGLTIKDFVRECLESGVDALIRQRKYKPFPKRKGPIHRTKTKDKFTKEEYRAMLEYYRKNLAKS